jgi:uncharacterized integral membrane protein
MLNRLILSSAPAALLLVLSFANLQPVAVSYFAGSAPVPLFLVVVAALLAGAFSGLSFGAALKGPQITSEKVLEWQTQDAKLAAEVKSDREKQLEAKVATLESALKQALKKS